MKSKTDLQPPGSGLASNPVLFGVAAGLADLFPPIRSHAQIPAETEAEGDGDHDPRDDE